MNLLKNLETRNTFLEQETKKLKLERIRCSKRASEILFILVGLSGEIEANKQIIEKIKKVEKKV